MPLFPPVPLRCLLPVLGALVLAAGCQVRAEVIVAAAGDGSGTVEVLVDLDADALRRVPDLDGDGARTVDDVAALVRVDDLEAAGWEVGPPATTDADGAELRAVKPFGTADEAGTVLAEVAGVDGALRDLRIERSTGLGETRLTFSGTADLSGGLEAFGDEALAAVLDGDPLGEDAAEIERRLGAPLSEMFSLVVRADLPGSVEGNGSGGDGASWAPALGGPPVPMEATARERDVAALVLVAVGVLSALGLVAVVVGRSLSARSMVVAPRP
jgi:hypothetical protein